MGTGDMRTYRTGRKFQYQGIVIQPVTSIVTPSIVSKLMEVTPAGTSTSSAIGFQRDFQIELRRCGRWVYGSYNAEASEKLRHRWEPSGGAVLSARVPAPKYDFIRKPVYQTSLRPGWTEDDLYRAVCRANGWCRQMVRLTSLRDAVYELAESREVDHDALEVIEAERGKDSSYDTMTEKDCAFWSEWLRSMPDKADAPTKQAEGGG
jgi:hypothetical protein